MHPEPSPLGAKDWRRLVTGSYTPEERATITWEQFSEMFRMIYVPLVERYRLD